jgi:hypothetical protein
VAPIPALPATPPAAPVTSEAFGSFGSFALLPHAAMAAQNNTLRSIPHTSIAERLVTTFVVEAFGTHVNNAKAAR